jgi:hypothetical protein
MEAPRLQGMHVRLGVRASAATLAKECLWKSVRSAGARNQFTDDFFRVILHVCCLLDPTSLRHLCDREVIEIYTGWSLWQASPIPDQHFSGNAQMLMQCADHLQSQIALAAQNLRSLGPASEDRG